MIKRVVRKFNSFEEAEAAEIEYWKGVSGERKIEILEELRSRFLDFDDERIERFQRVYRVIKQK
jgi:hypothetical protein